MTLPARPGFALLVLTVHGALAFPGEAQEPGPVLPGLAKDHPLDQAEVGTLLARELRCGACHGDVARFAPPPPGPDLTGVGSRITADYLREFLLDPHGAQPGTKMPDVLHHLPTQERAEVVESLTHFLASLATADADPPSPAGEAARGEELFHTIGCVACHPPRRPPEFSERVPQPVAGAVALDHVPAKYDPSALAAFLFQPERVRPSGRMPDMGLSRAEARDLARYLMGDEPAAEPFVSDPEQVARGAGHFAAVGCVACHPLEGLATSPPVPLADTAGGCLAGDSARGVDYALDGGQRAALVRALEAPAPADSIERDIALTLTALNCTACHVRDDYGGVDPVLDPYFTTDERDLGDDARIPPPLTLAGAKLDGQWMRDVIFEGASVRDYMHTRMPRYGPAAVGALPELFERADAERVEPFPMPTLAGEAKRRALDAGRDLMGIRGLGCISCHDFNGIPSNIHGGVDLIHSPTRLQPDWFARFLIEPETYRPGVVMPQSWPDGVATHRGILDGDTQAQVQAIWAYLSEGRTARNPEGLRPAPSHLEVGERPRVYRGRSSVAGYRGIAVGFPEGIHYAFDAQNGALAALWRGDFVSARWDGQGAGDFQPRSRPLRLARDVAFLRLEAAAGPWPLAPVKTEEQPINPDPTYPRNHGYRFRGYRIGADGVPTLRYASGAVDISERSEPIHPRSEPISERAQPDPGGEDESASGLRRILTLTAAQPQTLMFRVLTGEVEPVETSGGRAFQAGGLRVLLPELPVHRRPPSEGRPGDLLIEIDLPAGETRLQLDYALLD